MHRFADHVASLLATVSGSAGRSDARLRAAVRTRGTEIVETGQTSSSSDVAPDVIAYVDTIARGAFRVTDEDVDRLRRAGFSDDEIFDVTVNAAVSAGLSRLDRALRLLHRGS
jgi:alkylhydroperoxidase family enzyme